MTRQKRNIFNLYENPIDLDTFVDKPSKYRAKKDILKSATFEIRHLPHFEMVYGKSLLIKKFTPKFPKAKFFQGNNQLEDGIFFSSGDATEMFWPRCQKVSYEENKYQGFSQFKENCIQILNKYNRILEIPSISRIGLRYINVIETKPELKYPFDFFSAQIKFGDIEPKINSFRITHLVPPNVFVTTMMNPKVEKGIPYIIWDNDIFVELPMNFFQAKALLPVLHSVATKMFYGLLSENAKLEFIENEQ